MLAAVVVLLYLAALVLGVFLLLLYRQFGLLALGSWPPTSSTSTRSCSNVCTCCS